MKDSPHRKPQDPPGLKAPARSSRDGDSGDEPAGPEPAQGSGDASAQASDDAPQEDLSDPSSTSSRRDRSDSSSGAPSSASASELTPARGLPRAAAEQTSPADSSAASIDVSLDTNAEILHRLQAAASDTDATRTAMGKTGTTSSQSRRTSNTDVDSRPPTVRSLPPSRFTSGTVLAERYRIVHMVGRGGMGEVYRADDLKLAQPVALKFLPAALEKDRTRLEFLLSEVKLARAIAHPNVCRVYDVGEVDGQHFISMEYIEGEHLGSLLRRIGRVPTAKARELGQQMCQGLAAVHEQGILHRDLKPGNLMIDDYGRAKITDFGLASLAGNIEGSSIAHGTPAYMAPEQLAGEEVSIQSDIYALGLVLYQMFAGRFAFEGASAKELLTQRAEFSPVPLSRLVEDIDPLVEATILRCLELDPADRPASALDVALALANRAAPAEGAVLKTLLVCDPIGRPHWSDTLGPDGAAALMRAHARLTRALREQHGGEVVPGSSGLRMIFDRPGHAVRYALAYHRAVEALGEERGEPLRSRVGLHLGEVAYRHPSSEAEGATGLSPQVEAFAQETANRLAALAQPCQTLLTRGVFDLARQINLDDAGPVRWLAHGSYELEGLVEPIDVFEVGCEGDAPLHAPPESMAGRRQIVQHTISGWRPAPRLRLPQRPRWVLERKLSEGGFGEVWLAIHDKTRERRVFKFCYDSVSLRALQREITLFRLLKEALGERDDINRIFDWNFEEAPYFIESAYTEGGDLVEWAREQDEVPLETRLEIIAQVATALAAAHSVGILHKDVKPANVLVTTGKDGGIQAKLSDFGIGNVTERERLAEVGITVVGLTEASATSPGPGSFGGTRLYMAPEVLEGKPATVRADIYSLGVMLFQIAVGDFSRALAPGWERSVNDELLCQDIAAAVDGDPDERLGDALDLARRLRSLEERRRARAEEQRAREEARLARETLAKVRLRRRLMAILLAVAVVFSGSIWYQSRRVAREARAAQQVSDFLVELFESFDPYKVSDGEVSARQLLDQGAERIETELRDQPLIRARLMHIIGEVYAKLGHYAEARSLLEEALAIRVEHYGERHLAVAESQHALGEFYITKLDYDEAEAPLLAALETRRALRGEVHSEVADTLAALSQALLGQQELDRAEPFAQEALEMRQTLYGEAHPKIADSLKTLGTAAMARRDYEQAESYCRQAVAMYRELDSGDALALVDAVHMLARVLFLQHKDQEAETLFNEALNYHRRLFGEEHVTVARSLYHLGELAERRDDLEQARSLYEQAEEIYREAIGTDEPSVAYILNSLARLARREGDYARAVELNQEALSLYRRRYDSNNGLIVRVLRDLGDSLHAQGLYDQAESNYREALTWYRSSKGEESQETVSLTIDLAGVLIDEGELDAAESILEAARAAIQSLGEEGWLPHHLDSVLGAYESKRGVPTAAESLLVRSHEALRSQLGAEDRRTHAALRRLVSFYQSRDEADKAARYQALFPRRLGGEGDGSSAPAEP